VWCGKIWPPFRGSKAVLLVLTQGAGLSTAGVWLPLRERAPELVATYTAPAMFRNRKQQMAQ